MKWIKNHRTAIVWWTIGVVFIGVSYAGVRYDPPWLGKLIALYTSLLVPAIAALTGYVGWQQYRLRQNDIAIQLLPRRLAIYDATKSFIADFGVNGGIKHPREIEFIRATRDENWLFDDSDISAFLNELYQKAIEHETLEKLLSGTPVGPVRTTAVNKQYVIATWFAGQNDRVTRLFRPYLSLR